MNLNNNLRLIEYELALGEDHPAFCKSAESQGLTPEQYRLILELRKKELHRQQDSRDKYTFVKLIGYTAIVLFISTILVKKVHEPIYPFLFAFHSISSVICGFFMQSKGLLATNNVKTAAAVLSMLLGLSSIIFLIMCGRIWPILLPIAAYFFYCPIGAWLCTLIQIFHKR